MARLPPSRDNEERASHQRSRIEKRRKVGPAGRIRTCSLVGVNSRLVARIAVSDVGVTSIPAPAPSRQRVRRWTASCTKLHCRVSVATPEAWEGCESRRASVFVGDATPDPRASGVKFAAACSFPTVCNHRRRGPGQATEARWWCASLGSSLQCCVATSAVPAVHGPRLARKSASQANDRMEFASSPVFVRVFVYLPTYLTAWQ